MTELELCGSNEEHGLAQREIRTHKGDHHSRPFYLCDDCAARIDPSLLENGMTVTITPIGDN